MADGVVKNIFWMNAPAGSGKTTRIRTMIEKQLRDYPEDNILCITYTNRAADELGRGINSEHVFFGTIHSFINSFISSFFSQKEVIKLYWETYQDRIKDRIENAKGEDSVAESNQRYIDKYGQLDMETVYRNIEKVSYNEAPYNSWYTAALSHEELIIFAKKMADRFPVIKRKIADKYQLIFIDEYQDTATDVLDLFYDAMVGARGKLYLFGDKMQQIYQNYDGSFENKLLQMERMYLETNYRTTPQIVEILNHLYNDPAYNQKAFEGNRNEEMDYWPEMIITSHPGEKLAEKQKDFPTALTLYLLNKERFYSMGAKTLFDAVSKMEKYRYGRKYNVQDVLTTKDNTNPDTLFCLLFLFEQIKDTYQNGVYGTAIRIIKDNKQAFQSFKFEIIQHQDKQTVRLLVENILKIFQDEEETIGGFLGKLKEMDVICVDYLDAIMTDEYTDVLNARLEECHMLWNNLCNQTVSTQHGVKGESHDTVIFVAESNKKSPVVHMKEFLKLWSSMEISLPEFEMFFYSYQELIRKVEDEIGMSCSSMKKEDYQNKEEELTLAIRQFVIEQSGNEYYDQILRDKIEKFLGNRTLTNAKNCLKENIVYGILSAYRLFYVGCSRARKNLTVIINEEDIESFKEALAEKAQQCGFHVVM